MWLVDNLGFVRNKYGSVHQLRSSFSFLLSQNYGISIFGSGSVWFGLLKLGLVWINLLWSGLVGFDHFWFGLLKFSFVSLIWTFTNTPKRKKENKLKHRVAALLKATKLPQSGNYS